MVVLTPFIVLQHVSAEQKGQKERPQIVRALSNLTETRFQCPEDVCQSNDVVIVAQHYKENLYGKNYKSFHACLTVEGTSTLYNCNSIKVTDMKSLPEGLRIQGRVGKDVTPLDKGWNLVHKLGITGGIYILASALIFGPPSLALAGVGSILFFSADGIANVIVDLTDTSGEAKTGKVKTTFMPLVYSEDTYEVFSLK